MPNPVLPSCRWCPALPPLDRRRIPGLAEARRKEPAVRAAGVVLPEFRPWDSMTAARRATDRRASPVCWDSARPAPNKLFCMRRRTGIEPADDAARRPPVLKTGGATRHPDASRADVTRARRAPAIRLARGDPGDVVIPQLSPGRRPAAAVRRAAE